MSCVMRLRRGWLRAAAQPLRTPELRHRWLRTANYGLWRAALSSMILYIMSHAFRIVSMYSHLGLILDIQQLVYTSQEFDR